MLPSRRTAWCPHMQCHKVTRHCSAPYIPNRKTKSSSRDSKPRKDPLGHTGKLRSRRWFFAHMLRTHADPHRVSHGTLNARDTHDQFQLPWRTDWAGILKHTLEALDGPPTGIPCVTHVGSLRRRSTAAKAASGTQRSRSGLVTRFVAATAS